MGARMNGVLKGEHAPSYVARPFLFCAYVIYKRLLRKAQSPAVGVSMRPPIPTRPETGAPATYASYLKLTRSRMGPFDILSHMGTRENIQ